MLASKSGLPAPRMPKVPKVTSVEQILPAVRLIVKREPANMVEGLALKPGERVLILSDSTINHVVTEALYTAVKEAGGRAEVILLEGRPDLKEPVDLLDEMFSNNWFPDWVWNAAAASDVLVQLAFLKFPHTPNLPLAKGRPRVVGWELPPDLLLSEYITFPVELRDAIGMKTWQMLKGSREIELTDPLGTNLRFSLTQADWGEKGSEAGEEASYRPGHLMLPLPARDLEGTLVTTSITFGGPVPRTKMTIKGRQVIDVEGGGSFGQRLKESFDQYKNVLFPGKPGPGVNWLSTFGICTNPKARPSETYAELAGSARVHAWTTGHRRSGIIHTAIGMAMASPKYKVCRHVDLQFSILKADGKLIVECGHLTALDDPEIRKAAARYGDPDKLLAEDWIPGVIE